MDQLKYYKEKSRVKHNADTKDLALGFQSEIIVGQFVNRERPTWLRTMNSHYARVLGDQYRPYGGSNGQD